MRKFLIALLAVIAIVACTFGLTSCLGPARLEYEPIVENGETVAYSVKNVSFSPKTATIPETYNGKPVTEIAKNAFFYDTKLQSITIPSTITHIGENAFYGCIGLKNVYITDLEAWCGIHISGNDASPFYYNRATLYVNKKPLTDLVIPDGVESVGVCAFEGYKQLKSLTISDSVTQIGAYAFEDCLNLKSVNFGNGLTRIEEYTFFGCESLESLTIPDGITHIGDLAFWYCKNLMSVTLGSGLQTIGKDSFNFCDRLTAVYNHSSIEINNSTDFGMIGKYAKDIYTQGSKEDNFFQIDDGYWFYKKDAATYLINYCGDKTSLVLPTIDGGYEIDTYALQEKKSITDVVIPGCVTSMGRYSFEHCSKLKKVTIQNGISAIGGFGYCYKLTEITIPQSVTEIYESAFHSCESLKEITIPDGVTEIGGFAFAWCFALENVKLPAGLNKISNDAFERCTSLKSIKLPTSVTVIEKEAFEECTALTEINIPYGATEIGYNAFVNCKSLTSITLPDSVTELGNSAFRSCGALKSVTLSNGLTEINSGTFEGCQVLDNVAVGDNVTHIYENAFKWCYGLTRLTLPVSLIYCDADLGCWGTEVIVTYKGTVEQFNEIDFSNHGRIMGTVHCANGDVISC